MPKQSAGVLLHRTTEAGLEVLLVHPGGPLWSRRDEGAWSIPKGELEPGEDALAAARREVHEELGVTLEGAFVPLAPIRQKSGKVVFAWALEGDFDPDALRSGTFTMEWPLRSGRTAEFPEVDRAGWFGLGEARRKILEAQAPLIDQLESILSKRGSR